jgi:hypothetical protein
MTLCAINANRLCSQLEVLKYNITSSISISKILLLKWFRYILENSNCFSGSRLDVGFFIDPILSVGPLCAVRTMDMLRTNESADLRSSA